MSMSSREAAERRASLAQPDEYKRPDSHKSSGFGSVVADGAFVRTRDRAESAAAMERDAAEIKPQITFADDWEGRMRARWKAEAEASERQRLAESRAVGERMEREAKQIAARQRYAEQERNLEAMYITQGTTSEEREQVNEQMVLAGKFGDTNAHLAALQTLRWNREGK